MKYSHKPTIVEAMQFDGTQLGFERIMQWAGESAPIVCLCPQYTLEIATSRGTSIVKWGEWVIKGYKDEFYGCSDETFQNSYAPYVPVVSMDEAGEEEAKPKKKKK